MARTKQGGPNRIRRTVATRTAMENSMENAAPYITYGAPWAAAILGAPLVQMAHWAWGGNAVTTPFATLVTVGIGAGMSRLMKRLDDRAKADKDTRALHQVNIGALTVGATAGLVAGVDGAVAQGWVVAGLALPIANNLWAKFGAKGKEGAKNSKWADLEEKIGLERHELKEVDSNGRGVVTAKVEAKDGATAEDLSRKLGSLASALHVGRGRITHTVDDEDAANVTLQVKVADLLKEGFPWPGPSAFGRSIGDVPLYLGRYEDGQDLKVNLTGRLRDPDGLQNGNVEHCVGQGTTGAGKTFGNSILLADAATRTEVSTIVVNCTKFDQDFGHVRHAADMVITNEADARRFFKLLGGPVTDARSKYLASKGLKTWEPGCGLNFLLIVLEEAADIADGKAYAKVLRSLRSVGGWVLSSLQRATYDVIDTQARANHPAGMAYGLADPSDVQYVLPGRAVEEGAWPDWANRKPGYLYVAGMGIPENRWAVTARTYNAAATDLAAAVTAGMSVRTPMDATTAGAFGPLWDNRTFYTEPELGDAAPAPQEQTAGTLAPAPAVPAAEDDGDGIDYDDIEDAMNVDEDEVDDKVAELIRGVESYLAANDPEPGEYDHLSIHQEVEEPDPAAPVLDLGAPTADTLTSEQARQAIYNRLDEWVRGGKTSFRPGDLSDIWMRVESKSDAGRRRWFYRERDQLIEAGVISEDESDAGFGYYDLLRSPLADPPADGN